MKRILKWLGASLLLCIIGFFVFYLKIMKSDGTKDIQFIEPSKDYESFHELINQPEFKNKVIYVDFWHTGCRPCLVEFQSLPEMKSHFQKKAPIAFLYLGKDRSVPGEAFRWKKMVLDKNISGYHYFISDEQFDKFWDETVRDAVQKRFPHHLIISKQGKLVNNNAPGPSSKEIVSLLSAELYL